MKKEQKILPILKEKTKEPESNPVKKIKKTSTSTSVDNKIESGVGKTMARTGSGLANEGTSVSYEEER